MLVRMIAVLSLVCGGAVAAPQHALDRSPTPGKSYPTTASCLAPDVHDQMIEAVLAGEPDKAVALWRAAYTMGACSSHPPDTRAQYEALRYRFDWPTAPGFVGEQWEITLPDGEPRFILILVRDNNT